MRNEIAEWMLAQVAPPEQAKAVLGDLLEAQPGPLEFWFAVLRATASVAVRQPQQIFASSFWLAYEFGIFIYLGWVYEHIPYPSYQLLLRLAALIPIWLVGWLLHWRHMQPSQFAFFLGLGTLYVLLCTHAGLATWQMILSLSMIPAFWWRRGPLRQAKIEREKNRPTAG